MDKNFNYLFKLAFGLSLFTIFYNLVEGLVCTYLGFSDDCLTLFGFGIDSFIETISGLGILHMLTRLQSNPETKRDKYEKRALRITGFSFYLLVFGLVSTSIYNFVRGNHPSISFWGIVIACFSIVIMLILVIWKTKVGKALNSNAILADAECTKVCIYMSLVLLASSLIYWLTKFPYLDSIGAMILAYFSIREGKECFENAKSDKYCGCKHD